MTYQDYEQLDLGPLESLLNDGDITSIMVNGADAIYIEKAGQLIKTDARFDREADVLTVIQRILKPLGYQMDERTPIVDARLPDGSRITAVIRPIAVGGPQFTLRKFSHMRLTWDELVKYGSVDADLKAFLQACVRARLNLIVAGGTNAGKTTIMNALSEFIPDNERIITAEVTSQLNLRHPHVVAFETRPPNSEGQGAVTMADLITAAQHMRPDRIISSDVQGPEAWDMLRVMTLGFDGSMFTMHATGVQDALERLEMMATVATSLPLLQIRSRIAQAVDVIAQQLYMPDGTRKIVAVAEVVGLKQSVVETQDIFRFVQTGEVDARIVGKFQQTGYRPRFADRLDLPDDFFAA